jgi:hypothetical protein
MNIGPRRATNLHDSGLAGEGRGGIAIDHYKLAALGLRNGCARS